MMGSNVVNRKRAPERGLPRRGATIAVPDEEDKANYIRKGSDSVQDDRREKGERQIEQ